MASIERAQEKANSRKQEKQAGQARKSPGQQEMGSTKSH